MAQTLDNLLQTWNNAGTVFTGIKYNVTDTASAAGSLLMDLQVGGVSKFKVDKAGRVASGSGYTYALPQFYDSTFGTQAGFQITTSAACTIYGSNNALLGIESNVSVGIRIAGTLPIGWVNGHALQSAADVQLFRDAANTLAQRRTTTAGPVTYPQTFRIYNEYTDTNNYERGKIEWASNVLRIGTEKAGTGTARALEFQTDGTTRLTIGTTGAATFTGRVTTIDLFLDSGGSRVLFTPTADGSFQMRNNNGNDFGLLQFGGTTSSFPALKRSTTSLQVRLANDSAFTNIQGKLTTETAYTAGAPTATGYIVLYDSTGTAYKVPAEAL